MSRGIFVNESVFRSVKSHLLPSVPAGNLSTDSPYLSVERHTLSLSFTHTHIQHNAQTQTHIDTPTKTHTHTHTHTHTDSYMYTSSSLLG